jgi:hypothetical protein
MKRILVAAALAASLVVPAQAHADPWVAPLIGGIILGGIINQSQQPRTVYVQPAPVYIPPPVVYQQAPPVIVYRNALPPLPPQGDPYALQRQCHVEPIYNAHGQYLGQQQFCN